MSRALKIVAVVGAVLGAAGTAQAVSYTTYFGEDLSAGSPPHPNSAFMPKRG